MTTRMTQLLHAYATALVNETHSANNPYYDSEAAMRRYSEAVEKLRVTRANLVAAIEELEQAAQPK